MARVGNNWTQLYNLITPYFLEVNEMKGLKMILEQADPYVKCAVNHCVQADVPDVMEQLKKLCKN